MARRQPDLVCFSHLRWDFVWQRPQHLLSRAARERRVYVVEEPVWHDDAPRLDLREGREGVTVVVPLLSHAREHGDVNTQQEGLLRRLFERERIEDFVLWYYTPIALAFTRWLEPLVTVYDCMDELSGFAGAPRELHELEEELFARADLVFTGGRSLYEAKRERHGDVHLFPSSVDTAHFARARNGEREADDQVAIPRPRLGFFGVIDERLDTELVAAVADLRPDWQLVLVGPVTKIDPASLPQRANIHYLGAKPYEELPGYVAGWDVALLPFARNESTRFISPTKTPEYLAAGRPVVSTSIRDVVSPYGDEGLVWIADEPKDFAHACEQAMAADHASRLRRADAYLTEMSWDYTWADMRELIDDAAARRSTAARTLVPRREGFDWLVVGAGYAGSVLAERLAVEGNQRVLVCDVRSHIGGNAYDHYDDSGVLVHRYGPHIFHTNSREVFDYLSRFTEWRQYEHRVLASVDGMLVPLPINLDTINTLYGLDLSSDALDEWFAGRAESEGTSTDRSTQRHGPAAPKEARKGHLPCSMTSRHPRSASRSRASRPGRPRSPTTSPTSRLPATRLVRSSSRRR